jgi:hypothetical protein
MTLPDTPELARQAEAFYEQRLKELLEASHLHEFVGIEPGSGAYYLGPTLSEAVAAAREADPSRRYFVIRVGHPAALHLGGGARERCPKGVIPSVE